MIISDKIPDDVRLQMRKGYHFTGKTEQVDGFRMLEIQLFGRKIWLSEGDAILKKMLAE